MTTDFEKALDHLKSDESLSLPQLYLLSAPTRDQLVLFGNAWAEIRLDRRLAIIQNLADIAEVNIHVDFRPLFRHVMNDPNETVRATAIDGLWEDERHDLIDSFCRILENDPSVKVRASAAQALGKYVLQGELGELVDQSAQHIRDKLRDTFNELTEEVEVRRRALESIAYHNDALTSEMIRAAYEDTPHEMHVSAVFAMGRSCESAWSDIVLAEMDNPSVELRFEAARASGEIQIKEGVPALLDLLEDPDREVQEVSIWALGQIGGKRARQALEHMIQSEDGDLAQAAEEALGELQLMQGELGLSMYDFDMPSDEPILLDDLDDVDAEFDIDDWFRDREIDD